MSAYRRRFVVFTMLLIGVVLLTAFVILGVFMYRSDMKELQKTMSIVIEPWDSPNGSFRPITERPQRPAEGEAPPSGEPGLPPHGGEMKMISDEGILTVFYNSETDEISLLGGGFSMDQDKLASAVRRIVELGNGYGVLQGSGLIYRCEGAGTSYKLAIADRAYITSRTLRNALLLSGVLFGVLTLVFFVSCRLSALAARPMERALEMERQFVADLSHDLKTPVTVVLANNSILRSNADARVSEQLQWIDSTDSAARSMMELVNKMLTLSSLEASKGLERTGVNLSQTAEKCILQMESVAYDRRIELLSELSEGITVSAEQQSVERIVGGLIENALKYEPEGGRVAVTLSKQRKRAVLAVENAGSFIPSDELEHIFERFYRGDKARSERGFGLGLPILKRTAELIGARIGVESSPERGTVFSVSFELYGG